MWYILTLTGFSKAALENLTKTLAVELAPHKVRLNAAIQYNATGAKPGIEP